MEGQYVQRFQDCLNRRRTRLRQQRVDTGEMWLGVDQEKRMIVFDAIRKGHAARESYRQHFLDILVDAETALRSAGVIKVDTRREPLRLRCEDHIGLVHEIHLLQVGYRLYSASYVNSFIDGWIEPISEELSDRGSVPLGPRSDQQKQAEVSRFVTEVERFVSVVGTKLD